MSGTGHLLFECILFYQRLNTDFITADTNIGRETALHVWQQHSKRKVNWTLVWLTGLMLDPSATWLRRRLCNFFKTYALIQGGGDIEMFRGLYFTGCTWTLQCFISCKFEQQFLGTTLNAMPINIPSRSRTSLLKDQENNTCRVFSSFFFFLNLWIHQSAIHPYTEAENAYPLNTTPRIELVRWHKQY